MSAHKEVTAYCRVCMVFGAVQNYDERKDKAICPGCGTIMQISYHTLDDQKDKLGLFDSEILQQDVIKERM